MKLSHTFFAAGLAVTLGFGAAAQAAIVDAAALAADSNADIAAVGQALTGAANSDFDGWANLSGSAYPGYSGFPGTGAWPGPMQSTAGSDAALHKIANGAGGGPYPASGSIYFGGFSGDLNYDGGRLAVQDATPLADLQTIAFQIQIGEAWGYDFHNDVLPTLSINGGSELAASFNVLTERLYTGTVPMPTGDEDVYMNTYLLVWDLSADGLGITDTVTDFSIAFNGVQHAQLYSLRLDQSDAAIVWPAEVVDPTTPAVPEPATAGLMALGGAAMLLRRRRHA